MLHGPGCLDSGSSAFYGALACATQATRNGFDCGGFPIYLPAGSARFE